MIGRLGKRGYTIAFSLVSLVTLIWCIAAALNAPVVPVWDAAGWQAWTT